MPSPIIAHINRNPKLINGMFRRVLSTEAMTPKGYGWVNPPRPQPVKVAPHVPSTRTTTSRHEWYCNTQWWGNCNCVYQNTNSAGNRAYTFTVSSTTNGMTQAF